MERPRGIEPLSLPWQGRVLPLNHGRVVPRVRIELTTRRSSGVCSTTELPRLVGDRGLGHFTLVSSLSLVDLRYSDPCRYFMLQIVT